MTVSGQWQDVRARIQARWHELTDEDIAEGVTHRATFLERLCRRHGLGLDEAEKQLQAFEDGNPELLFERS